MTDQAKFNVPDGSQLPKLVHDLLQQPFSQARNLGTMSWEQACALLEGSLPADPESDSLRESFEQTKALYCLVLMELEAHQLAAPTERPLAQWFAAPKTAVAPKKTNNALTGPTRDFWSAAQWLAEQAKHELPFPREYAERLQGQCLSFAVDCECQRLFVPLLPAFWTIRQEAIAEVVEDTDTFALNKDLRAALDGLSKQHIDWLGDAKIPHTVVSMALRYMHARLSHQDFIPAPSEAAVLALFFGHTETLGGWTAQNQLGLRGLKAEETIELCFRLFHAQRLRKRLLTVSQPVDGALLQTIVANSKRVLQLAHKLRPFTKAAETAA